MQVATCHRLARLIDLPHPTRYLTQKVRATLAIHRHVLVIILFLLLLYFFIVVVFFVVAEHFVVVAFLLHSNKLLKLR